MFDTLSKAGKYLGQAAKMMIGVPDYDNYVEHMRITHPDQTPMTYEEFFRERQDARYGGKGVLIAIHSRQDHRNRDWLHSSGHSNPSFTRYSRNSFSVARRRFDTV